MYDESDEQTRSIDREWKGCAKQVSVQKGYRAKFSFIHERVSFHPHKEQKKKRGFGSWREKIVNKAESDKGNN